MKTIYLTILILVLTIISIPQEIQHETSAINIEVPVRVFKADKFIDNLTIDDFQVFEDGNLQRIEAIYLIKKTTIEREDKLKEMSLQIKPQVARQFVLAFDVINWLPKIGDSIDYFFENVFLPGDSLIIDTPVKSYQLGKKALEGMPNELICSQLKALLRKDIVMGNMEYKSMIRDIKWFESEAKKIESEEKQSINASVYRRFERELFFKIRDYKYFDEEKLLVFKDYLKNIDGQKHVFLFYQKEEIPYPKQMRESDLYSRDTSFDTEKIKRQFSDSTISIHFLFLTNQLESTYDIANFDSDRMPLTDQSYQVFSAFYEISKTSGGLTYASANPFAALKRASDASENYYLLYYTPKSYESDGKFKNIAVKVKSGKYRILHRAGYLAD